MENNRVNQARIQQFIPNRFLIATLFISSTQFSTLERIVLVDFVTEQRLFCTLPQTQSYFHSQSKLTNFNFNWYYFVGWKQIQLTLRRMIYSKLLITSKLRPMLIANRISCIERILNTHSIHEEYKIRMKNTLLISVWKCTKFRELLTCQMDSNKRTSILFDGLIVWRKNIAKRIEKFGFYSTNNLKIVVSNGLRPLHTISRAFKWKNSNAQRQT